MPEITAISSQKRKGRYNIFVDGKFGFGTDEDTLVKEQLTVGKEISEWKLEHLIEESEVGKLYQKALRFLGFRPRSEKEVREYLDRKLATAENAEGAEDAQSAGDAKKQIVDSIIERLRSQGYINDEEFVSWWVRQRQEFKPRGKILLRQELYQKGVSREIIDQELEADKKPATQKHPSTSRCGAGAEVHRITEEELALGAAQKKLRAYKNLEPFEFRRKMGAYLTRRGFEWEVIKEVVDGLLEKR